jgi:Activator of Hsp90 ATPase homolog 1-like protein
MIDNSYMATIEVTQSPKETFNCLKDVSKWWSRDYEGSSGKLNDEFVIEHPGTHYSKHKLIELIPDQKMVWLVTNGKLNWLKQDQSEWTNTKMIFEISQKEDKTVVHFTHEGLLPEKECYDMCAGGWNLVIKNCLFNYITAGTTI